MRKVLRAWLGMLALLAATVLAALLGALASEGLLALQERQERRGLKARKVNLEHPVHQGPRVRVVPQGPRAIPDPPAHLAAWVNRDRPATPEHLAHRARRDR